MPNEILGRNKTNRITLFYKIDEKFKIQNNFVFETYFHAMNI